MAGELGPLGGRGLNNLNRDVGAPEAVNEAGRLHQPQLHGDVILNDGRGRGGQSDHRRWAQAGQVLPQHAVIRPEIVSPLRNAVCLVNGNKGQRSLGQQVGETGHMQPLRRDE